MKIFYDIRYAFRALIRSYGFAATVVTVMALGVGATSFAFVAINAVVLSPLPYPNSEELVHIELISDENPNGFEIGMHDVRDIAERQTSFETLFAYSSGTVNVSGGDSPVRYDGIFVTANALSQIGVAPAMGRTFVEGEFVSIMGPSGAGKSTLLNILGMFDSAFEGEYWLAGEPVHEMNQKQRSALGRRHIGFVFQQYHLLDDLTVYENLEIPLSYRDYSRSEREAIVADMLDRFGIVGKQGLYPSQLSGGQQQLVAVARAMVASPSLVLADEPTGALHSDQGRMIMETLRTLNAQGTTIVQVTHAEDNAAYGNRVIRLRDGWLDD